jgi:hypothetical protein
MHAMLFEKFFISNKEVICGFSRFKDDKTLEEDVSVYSDSAMF